MRVSATAQVRVYFLFTRIHAQGNSAKLKNHPDGRAIMFEGPVYSKRVILDFTTTLAKFEEVLKFIELFDGTCAFLKPVLQ